MLSTDFVRAYFALGSRLLLSVALILGLSACVSSIENAPPPKRQSPGDEFDAYVMPADVFSDNSSPSYASPPRTIREPDGILTLRESLSSALTHNPELAIFSWEIRMRSGGSASGPVPQSGDQE